MNPFLNEQAECSEHGHSIIVTSFPDKNEILNGLKVVAICNRCGTSTELKNLLEVTNAQ
jgi:hypothetical protein